MFWIKNPIDVLSVERVLQEITYKTVSQEAAGVENERWLMCLRPYLFPNHLESPDKEHLGIPYYEYPGCLSQGNELPAIFPMRERFYLISPTLMITQCPQYSLVFSHVTLKLYLHMIYFKKQMNCLVNHCSCTHRGAGDRGGLGLRLLCGLLSIFVLFSRS